MVRADREVVIWYSPIACAGALVGFSVRNLPDKAAPVANRFKPRTGTTVTSYSNPLIVADPAFCTGKAVPPATVAFNNSPLIRSTK